MQINNPNGQSIIIDEIYVNKNRIDYTKYDYGGVNGTVLEKKPYIFSGINLIDYLTQEVIFEELCYDNLILEVEPDYVKSEVEQNWLYPSTNIRIYIPAITYNSVVNSGNELDLLVQQFIADDWIALQAGIHYYQVTLSDDDRAILEAYSDIIIEDKI